MSAIVTAIVGIVLLALAAIARDVLIRWFAHRETRQTDVTWREQREKREEELADRLNDHTSRIIKLERGESARAKR